MAIENGACIIQDMGCGSPDCIRSWQDLIVWIDVVELLPLFKNKIDGFSLEEHTTAGSWWNGDLNQGPWKWRQRRNKQDLLYGWPISVYATPETLWGYEHAASAYGETPEVSHFPAATEVSLRAVLGRK